MSHSPKAMLIGGPTIGIRSSKDGFYPSAFKAGVQKK